MAVLLAVVALGLLSRSVRLGNVVWNKYLGDALYAVMVYLLLRLAGGGRWAWAGAILLGIELFQLTGVPGELVASGNGLSWVAGRLLGTTFGWGDLAAYAVGLALAVWGERPRVGGFGKAASGAEGGVG